MSAHENTVDKIEKLPTEKLPTEKTDDELSEKDLKDVSGGPIYMNNVNASLNFTTPVIGTFTGGVKGGG